MNNTVHSRSLDEHLLNYSTRHEITHRSATNCIQMSTHELVTPKQKTTNCFQTESRSAGTGHLKNEIKNKIHKHCVQFLIEQNSNIILQDGVMRKLPLFNCGSALLNTQNFLNEPACKPV